MFGGDHRVVEGAWTLNGPGTGKWTLRSVTGQEAEQHVLASTGGYMGPGTHTAREVELEATRQRLRATIQPVGPVGPR